MSMVKQKTSFREIWRKYRLLFLGLSLPLLAISILFLFLARPFSLSDLLLNIATDFITLIITIWYVDWILEEHDDAKWEGTHKYIIAFAGEIAHGIVSIIAEKTGLSREVFPKNDPPFHTRSISDIQQEIIENVRKLSRENIIAHLDKLSAIQWQELFQSLRKFQNDISVFLSQFGPRLRPYEQEAILSMRMEIVSTISSYELFYDFLGVPIESMPKVKDDKPWEYAALATIRIGIELQLALQQAINVISVFDYIAEQPVIDWDNEVSTSWKKYQEISRFQS
jgi:hypothetical protein